MTTLPQAIVVGVGSEHGLGAALARRFAREGLHVIVSGRTLDRLEKVVATIVESGGQASSFVADVTVEKDVIALFDHAGRSADATLDLVVFNAGNNVRQDFRTMPTELFESHLACKYVWRISGRARSGTPVSAAEAREHHFHRRHRERGRQAAFHRFRCGKGRLALVITVNGMRVRSAWYPCCACRYRRRHRWRKAEHLGTTAEDFSQG